MHDLRSFIASAEKSAELLRVDRETDPLTEMGVLFRRDRAAADI